jgi:hypothetical protein
LDLKRNNARGRLCYRIHIGFTSLRDDPLHSTDRGILTTEKKHKPYLTLPM